MSQSKPQETDDEEFDQLFKEFSGKLQTKAESLAESKEQARVHADDPDLAAVKACLADHRAGRVNPKNSPLWPEGYVN